jgi:hypothetical protein
LPRRRWRPRRWHFDFSKIVQRDFNPSRIFGEDYFLIGYLSQSVAFNVVAQF